jgi:hypothetical protein
MFFRKKSENKHKQSKNKKGNDKMKMIFFWKVFVISMLIMGTLTMAHSEDIFNLAEEIIKEKVSCNQLTNGQLEAIGDYYMDQMHPGEAHKIMDKIMGGEGSEELRLMHIRIARNFYCGEHEVMTIGMMDMMMGRGITDNSVFNKGGITKMGYGMMGMGGYFGFYHVLSIILLVGLIILVYLWIWKLWKNMNPKLKK